MKKNIPKLTAAQKAQILGESPERPMPEGFELTCIAPSITFKCKKRFRVYSIRRSSCNPGRLRKIFQAEKADSDSSGWVILAVALESLSGQDMDFSWDARQI
jgi:hypothetical protein